MDGKCVLQSRGRACPRTQGGVSTKPRCGVTSEPTPSEKWEDDGYRAVRESETETETEGNRVARGRGEPEPRSSDSRAPTTSLTTSLQRRPSVNTTQREAPGFVAVSAQTEGQLPGGVVGGGDGAGAVTPTPLGPPAPQAAQMSSLGRHLSAGHGSRGRNRGRHRPGSFTHKD